MQDYAADSYEVNKVEKKTTNKKSGKGVTIHFDVYTGALSEANLAIIPVYDKGIKTFSNAKHNNFLSQ